MSSGRMPSFIHQKLSPESRQSAVAAQGAPLSVRMRWGRPYSWKLRVNTSLEAVVLGCAKAWHARRERE